MCLEPLSSMYSEAFRSLDGATLCVVVVTVTLIGFVNFVFFRNRSLDGPLFAVSPQSDSGFRSVSEILRYTYPKVRMRADHEQNVS